MTGKITILGLLASGILLGCTMERSPDEQALIDAFEPINTREGFVAFAVGPRWTNDEIKVSFDADGGLSGDINGVAVTGTWIWQNDQICTTFLAADAGGEGCSKLGSRPSELLVIPRGGSGAPYTYVTG
ncbi:MAG: hypothetical protein AAGF94_09355 [Pseudomonadota bacterium]